MRQHAPPRGSSLLFVVSLLAVLSFGAVVLVQQVGSLSVLSYGKLRQMRLEQAAHAGALQGANLLLSLLYASDDAPMDLSRVQQLERLDAQDMFCSDGIDCHRWLSLGQGPVAGEANQWVRMAAACNPSCFVPTAQIVNFQVRAIGTLQGGGNQLVEVFLER